MDVPTLSGILQHHGLEEASLNKEISRKYFTELSSFLVEWRQVAPILDLDYAEVTAIEENHVGNARMMRIGFLERWKQKSGNATYGALMKALLRIKERADAQGVCEVLKWGEDFSCTIAIG